jgi:hypothetical protein
MSRDQHALQASSAQAIEALMRGKKRGRGVDATPEQSGASQLFPSDAGTSEQNGALSADGDSDDEWGEAVHFGSEEEEDGEASADDDGDHEDDEPAAHPSGGTTRHSARAWM